MSAVIANSNAVPTVWTIRGLLEWTTTYLAGKGVESPRLDAQILLAHVLKCPRIELIARSTEEPPAQAKTAFRELVKRRVDGWPVAYLTGRKEFYLLPFKVSPAVLVPRPDTETLVLEALNWLKTKPHARVLELGTGSGCLAAALAVNAPGITIDTVELSPDAADIARENFRTLQLSQRITVVPGDLYAPLKLGTTYDLIVSNPPYIATAEIETLSPDVKDHEPRIALDGGPDGLNFYRRISNDVLNWLTPDGAVMVEIGEGQDATVAPLFQARGLTVTTRKDAGGRVRVVVGKR